MQPWTLDFANSVYDVLIACAGAREDLRDVFVHAQTSGRPPVEFRFQGRLGFGGKLWRDKDNCYVSCYQEDLNEKTEQIINVTNQQLRNLCQ